MLRKIQITEKDYGRVVSEYPIVLEIADASDADYCEEAWENAIDDGLADLDCRSDYEIEFVDEDIHRE